MSCAFPIQIKPIIQHCKQLYLKYSKLKADPENNLKSYY